MQISNKSISETITFIVDQCRRSVDGQQELILGEQQQICKAYEGHLVGLRYLFIDCPSVIAQIDDANEKILAMAVTFAEEQNQKERQDQKLAEFNAIHHL